MTMLSRRAFLTASTALALAGPLQASAPETPGVDFGPQTVRDLARDLASRPYEPRPTVPQDWLDLTYDQYRDIRFAQGRALWTGTDKSYNVDFFAPGLYFPRTIKVWTVEDGQARPVGFDLDLFDKGKLVPKLTREDPALGYSGLRLRTDLGHPSGKTEYAVFQGASYFRAIGLGLTYGLSARGLALKTADPEGEEFPDFTQFWLEAPAPGQKNMVVHALMDSPSVTGAYRFDISPGDSAVMEVEAVLFPRTDLDNVGLAPLTSMFFFDETNRHRFDDFRPAVHDNDGLMIWNGAGEVIWRPLANPLRLQVSSFVDNGPRGFGLMQRARDLGHYADLEAHYHNRPGLWVKPHGDWGRGAVTLVEIPTDKEIYDNIVAYWRPAEPIAAGSEHEMSYRLTWGAAAPVDTGLPRVLNTRMGEHHDGTRLVTVDFEASPLFAEGPDMMQIVVHSPHADTSDGVLQHNPDTGGLRLAFTFDPGTRDHAELRAQLRKDGQPASEVWLYRWTPS
ncbi:MAG: glucan biosynthesis protein G [Marinibacterium sp.]|nr:glucan biosynthesis protein G [Marinibacterium sp.]